MVYLVIVLVIALLLVLVLVFVFISHYNTMQRGRNQIDNALSSLDALFIKRNEMIPNLIAVVQQYTGYESNILEKLTALRQQSGNRNSGEYHSEGETDKLLKQLMVQVENYPELKASQQFTNLQHSINECEEQIAAGRRYLSSSITSFNNSVTTFPGNMIAGFAGKTKYEWERAEASQRENVNVRDQFNRG